MVFDDQCASAVIMKIKNTGVRFARFSFFGRMSRRQTFSVPAAKVLAVNGHDGVQRAVKQAWLRETQISI
jgi:hypothetical protein